MPISRRLLTLIGLPTDNKSNTISLIAKSNFSCAMNWMILTNMLSGASLGTTALDPLGNKELTMLCRRDWVTLLLSHLMRTMYTQRRR